MRPAGAFLEALHQAGRGLPLWMAFQGLAMGAAFAFFAARARGPLARTRPLLLLSYAGAALGGALLGVLLRVPAWLANGGPASALLGGVAAYGALGGLVGSFALLARLRGVPVAAALDALAPCLGILVVFGRLGCFFAGCDFGTVTGAPWAVRFSAPSPAFAAHLSNGLVLATDHRSLPVHPTQMYEVLVGAGMLTVVIAANRPHRGGEEVRRAGVPFWLATLVYAAGRLIVDGFRGDAGAERWGPLSASRWISLAVVIVAVFALRRAAKPGVAPARAA